ncbi:MAG: C-terminal binding protein [Acidimicrobiales bacterium]
MKIALQASPWNRVDLFEAAGFEVIEEAVSTEDEFIDLLKQADGAEVSVIPRTSRRVLEACPNLKVVSRMGVGVDSIDLDAATELGILACNVPGVNTAEVADHAMAMLLSHTRRIHDGSQTMRAGGWSEPGVRVEYVESVRRIAGHTVGIIGFGDIGRAFASRVRAFGPAKVVAYDPYVAPPTGEIFGVEMLSLEEVLSQSDFISIHCTSTAETKHLINAQTLDMMKPTAILVNTSRGPVVDGAALADALEANKIQAAALDVTEIEPIDPGDRLLKLDNCIVTPHVAGYSPTFLDECPRRQAENVIRVLTGTAPHGLANPEVIKTIAVMRASTEPGRWDGVPDFSTALRL